MIEQKEIKFNELQNYDGKIVFVTFNCNDITIDNSAYDYDTRVDELKEEYPDKNYRVNFKDKRFETLESDSCNLYFSHNFIDKIYESK